MHGILNTNASTSFAVYMAGFRRERTLTSYSRRDGLCYSAKKVFLVLFRFTFLFEFRLRMSVLVVPGLLSTDGEKKTPSIIEICQCMDSWVKPVGLSSPLITSGPESGRPVLEVARLEEAITRLKGRGERPELLQFRVH
jgi:hypothetical protein